MKVLIPDILRNFNKRIPFEQPLYETIVNSLEANATKIEIQLERTDSLVIDGKPIAPKVRGFTITDNGDGFNQKNRESFLHYLSSVKLNLGCKGVGRFTWLKVFDTINVKSWTGEEFVEFSFNKDFKDEDILPQETVSKDKKTIITFSDVTTSYYSCKTKKNVDKRTSADLEVIKKKIENYLLVKLFLLSEKKDTAFEIKLMLDNQEVLINNANIPDLKSLPFEILDPLNNSFYVFNLYYKFIDTQNNLHNLFYCGNGRQVKKFKDDLKLGKLPDKASVIMLLTSDYFDNRINDERNDFTLDENQSDPSFANPIPFHIINKQLKEEISKILSERYPTLVEGNKRKREDCTEEYPHLAKYIRNQDSSIIEDKAAIISQAKKEYEKDLEKIKNDFLELLKSNNIDQDVFIEQALKVSEMSARELAQYFLYREQIIKGLERLHMKGSSREADLHNLFMKMGKTSVRDEDTFSKYDSNIWLLDDKFMSYTGMFSDKKIKIIKEHLKEKSSAGFEDRKEPDLAIFYNQIDDENRDIVVVEFKAIGAKELDKGVSAFELSRNIGNIIETLDNIRTVYGYVITKMDAEFSKNLSRVPGMRKLFSKGKTPFFYQYAENFEDINGNKVDTHLYYLCSETIYRDAKSRNETFLDIIRNA